MKAKVAALSFCLKGFIPALSCQANGPCAVDIQAKRGWTKKDRERAVTLK